ncbi:MAG: hypothetical protein IPL23_01395 [Saprospiraceae bacterium]|nr:hypothetical protein [Saprospiraceae bacterium]
MFRKSKILIILAAVMIIEIDLFSQNFLSEKVSFQVGLSMGKADTKKLYKWGNNTSGIGNIKLESDFYFSINRQLLNKNRFYVQGGIGYLVNMHRVANVINLAYFDLSIEPLWYNSLYIKNNLYLPLDFKYYLSNKRKISIISSNTMSFTFHKLVKKLNGDGAFNHFKKWTLDPSNLETFIGFGFDRDKFQYFGQIRVFNLMFKDDALSNNGKEIDYYNPLKFRLGMGMKF